MIFKQNRKKSEKISKKCLTNRNKSDRITKLSPKREPGGELKGIKNLKKVLKKYLTKGFGCDIIVESPKSEELKDGIGH